MATKVVPITSGPACPGSVFGQDALQWGEGSFVGNSATQSFPPGGMLPLSENLAIMCFSFFRVGPATGVPTISATYGGIRCSTVLLAMNPSYYEVENVQGYLACMICTPSPSATLANTNFVLTVGGEGISALYGIESMLALATGVDPSANFTPTVTNNTVPLDPAAFVFNLGPVSGNPNDLLVSLAATLDIISHWTATGTNPFVLGLSFTETHCWGLAYRQLTSTESDSVAWTSTTPGFTTTKQATFGFSFRLPFTSAPIPLIIPDIIGDTASVANAAITSPGFTVGSVTSQPSTTVAAGLVISQSPVGGSIGYLGEPVNYILSSGPPTPPPIISPPSIQAAPTPSAGAINPVIELEVSDDGGWTWRSLPMKPLGVQGAYLNRAVWFKLGSARDRVYRFSVSDPVPTWTVDIQAELQGGKY